MLHQLPRHSGAPFHSSISALDFGTCAGLRLPFDGQVLNATGAGKRHHLPLPSPMTPLDGRHLRIVSPPSIAYKNEEIDPRLYDERHRWPIDAPGWMLSMSCDAAYSFASKKYPSMGVPRSLLYNYFFEDAELLRQQRRNAGHGNVLRLVPAMIATEMGEFQHVTLALHPAGPFLNVLHLSRVAATAAISGTGPPPPNMQLIVQSSIDVSSTILDISAPSPHLHRCDRIVTVTTTSQIAFFVRIRTSECRKPQIELLHQIALTGQLFPAICNPLLFHECSIIADDGRVTIYDAATCTSSIAATVNASESAWLRQAYTCHPRVLHIASRRQARRLDLRANTFESDVAGSLVYNHDPSLVIVAFNSNLRDPFTFAIANWDHIALFDERYTSRPLCRWQHHRQGRPFSHIEIAPFDGGANRSEILFGFGHDHNFLDVYRYAKDGDGWTSPLSSPQQLDLITHARIRGAAFFSPDHSVHCYRVTELGTMLHSEYRLVSDAVDLGEPCPPRSSEDPLALLSRSILMPYNFIDFTNPIRDILESNSTGDGKSPALSHEEMLQFMLGHCDEITGFVAEWRSFSELYRYLRSDLDMPAASSSFNFYNAVNGVIDDLLLTSRLVVGMSDDELQLTQQSAVAVRNFPTMCTCSLSSRSECQPATDCLYPGVCQALLRTAICANDQIVRVDFDQLWTQVGSENSPGDYPEKSVDFSADVAALMAFIDPDPSGSAPEPRPSDGEHVVDILKSLKQSWHDFMQTGHDDAP